MPADKPHGYGAGSISKRADGRWQVRVSVDGRQLYRYAATAEDAEKIRRALVREKQRGKLKPDPPKLRLDALLDKWLATKTPPEVTPRALAVYERRTRLQIRPSLGHLRAADLKPADVADWLRLLVKAGYSTTTIGAARSVLSEALEWAVDLELLTRNPARRVRTPRGRAPIVRTPPDRETALAFLAAVSGHRLAALWHLAAYLGLRRGELLGLTWAAVDLDRGTLRVDSQLIWQAGVWTLPAPKSAAGRRTLPLAAPLPELLARRRREQLAERLRAVNWGPDLGLVFTREDGAPLEKNALLRAQRECAVVAGAANVGLHQFRHGVATLLLTQDAPARIVQAFLGHAGRSVTESYQHPTVETLRPYAKRIAAHWETPPGEKLGSDETENRTDGVP